MKTTLKVSEIKNNPNNPRLIKDDKFKKLVQSLKQLPIMLEKRPVIIDENNVIIGGNMRHKAAKEAGLKEVPVETFTRDDAEKNNAEAKKLNPDYIDKSYEEQVREMVIKDNVSGGEWDWDILANEWDNELIADWGLDLPAFKEIDDIVVTRDGSLASSLQDEELRDSMSVVLTFDKAGFVEFMTYANYFRQKYNTQTATEAVVEAVKDHYENSISVN